MMILQHRANNLAKPVKTNYAEIDVQIDATNQIVVSHELWTEGAQVDYFLDNSRYEKFLINIKQNLDVKDLRRIVNKFYKRSLGLFDVPFPSAYYAVKAGLKVWGRLSEYEKLNRLFSRFWVDPLVAQTPDHFLTLIAQADPNHELIIASPDLHGASFDNVLSVWEALKCERNNDIVVRRKIVGLVTRYAEVAKGFFRC